MKARRRKTRKSKANRDRTRDDASRQISLLPRGLESRIERVVPFEWTIAAMDSRLPAVFSTPSMIGMMEVAAAQAIACHLPQGTISVGTRIEVDHLKAVPEGALVEARAKYVGSRDRFLAFEAEARSGDSIIGRGKVFRAIVPLATFLNRKTS